MYYLRADPLGNSLYRLVDGHETALTSERQVVNGDLRLSLDEHTISFESRIDSSRVLVIHDVASGTARRMPRNCSGCMGWLLPGAQGVLWSDLPLNSLVISDTAGAKRRNVVITISGAVPNDSGWWLPGEPWTKNWALSPDGSQVALIAVSHNGTTLARVTLAGGATTILGRFPSDFGDVSIASWSKDGTIHLLRSLPERAGSALVALNSLTGTMQVEGMLPFVCAARTATYAATARRGACTVPDQRADVMILDGIRP